MVLELLEQHLCFGGTQRVYTYYSEATQCNMRFGLFLPPDVNFHQISVLYWLSGLTCTEQNFIMKAGAQRMAAKLGLVLVIPDTSPPPLNLPHEQDHYDFGVGAGFYLDATQQPWRDHYQMATWIRDELPLVLKKQFSLTHEACGIFGHSMGGHGALTLALNNPTQYRSVSAFAPICAPTQVEWGQKAFTGYLGEDRALWNQYDACSLIQKKGWPNGSILIDQGSCDPFLDEHLKPELFQEACQRAQVPLDLRMQEGYDHSYYFIASFVEDHLVFHASSLQFSS